MITSITGLLEYNKNIPSGKTEEEEELQKRSSALESNGESQENNYKINEQEGIEAFLTYISKKLDSII